MRCENEGDVFVRNCKVVDKKSLVNHKDYEISTKKRLSDIMFMSDSGPYFVQQSFQSYLEM